MNKIYKIKKNSHGQSVVTSELAKNKSVGTTVLAVIAGTTLLSLSSFAQAEPIVKTATGLGATATVDENNITLKEASSAIIGQGNDGASADVTVRDSTITTAGTDKSAVVAEATSSTPDTVGSVTLMVAGGTYSTTSSTNANVIVGQIKDYTGAGDEVKATVTKASVIAEGPGSANGVLAKTTANSGKVTIISTGSTYNIQTKGNAIVAASDSVSGISISSTNDNITSAQGGGISAKATAGEVSVLVADNTINSSGIKGHGINVETSDKASTISVNSSQMTYNSSGSNSAAINVLSKSAGGNIDITTTNMDAKLTGRNGSGIIAATDSGASTNNIKVTSNGGSIKLDSLASAGPNGFGIYAVHGAGSVNSGSITISNKSTSITTGNVADAGNMAAASHAIKADVLNDASTGNITVTNSGELVTLAGGSNGIDALNKGQGLITLTNNGKITTSGIKSHGINISGSNNNVKVTHSVSDGAANGSSFITTNGAGSSGINVTGVTSGTIDINTGKGAIITTNGDNGANGISVKGNSSLGNVNITNGSTINVNGKSSSGINYESNSTSQGVTANIVNNGDINLSRAEGEYSAITANTKDNDALTITNAGNITQTSTSNSLGAIKVNLQTSSPTTTTGVGASSSAKTVVINNSGSINTQNGIAIGAYLANGDITINNSADITTSYSQSSELVFSHGIQASSDTGKVTINHDGGTIKIGLDPKNASNSGIMAYQNDTTKANAINVSINNSAVVDSSLGQKGIDVRTSGTGNIHIGASATVTGGAHSAVAINGYSKSGVFNVVNDGTLKSSNDRAVFVENGGTANVSITNSGNMTGYIQSGTKGDTQFAATNLTNNGLWDISNTYQAAALNGTSYTKDTEGVAISSFGGGTINNQGTISLVERNSALTLDSTNEYNSIGALSMADGASQAQLLNVSAFSNSGIIDLTANGTSKAGNVMVITGGSTAGTNGDGTFTANGGAIKMNTVINQGDVDSQSDMLVLDNVKLGTEATKIYVTPVAGSVGVKTVGDGIKLIDVLGTQDNNAFVLGSSVTYGGYEYRLTNGTGNGFYLTYFDQVGTKMPDPKIGSHLANQYIAANMFNQDIYDRRYSVREGNSAIWGRTNYSKSKSDILNGRQHFKADTYIMQIGADIVKTDDFVGGIYYGYGHSNIKNHSNQSGTKSDSMLDGYMMGIYASWVPDENKGPYADFWGHGAMYKNALKGDAQSYKIKYDSYGYALSLEGGYGFVLSEDSESGRSWILQPHNQVIFNRVNADAFTDSHGTEFAKSNTSGITNRLGVRFYSNYADNVSKYNPFVEANWIYNNMSDKTHLDTESYDETIGRNVGEVKLGLIGKLTKNTSVWGQVSQQFGSDSYRQSQIQFNFSYEY